MNLFTKEELLDLSAYAFAFIEVEYAGHLLTITLNRPEKKNALHPVMVNELAFALRYAHHHNEVWAVLLRANGDVFCAGADLKAFMGEAGETNSTVPKAREEILIGELFNSLYKPCIAQVEGNVYAGGFLLICGCTHVIALPGVQFLLPEVKRGLFPFQVMASLLEIMPARQVLSLCMHGGSLNAQDAAGHGLVTEVAAVEMMEGLVNAIILDLFSNSPTAIRRGLEAYDHIRKAQRPDQHAYLHGMLMATIKTKDAREGIAAFKEKRKPVWTGE